MAELTAGMSVEEQIGQLFMCGFPGTSPSPDIVELIQRHHLGGVILFSRNIGTAHQVLDMTSALQEIARAAGHRAPLLIAIDQENGIVRRLGDDTTIFPGNMALGAIGSGEVVYGVARATGRELKALGINMNLAPVVDVNNNPANPVIGVRSFGEDPQLVARLGVAALKGYRAAGVVSSLKHFPGYGDVAVDPHLGLPVIPHTVERLDAIELVPFRSGIHEGADSVMIAHIYLPKLMGREVVPATLSPAVVRGLLRERLGYEGVIVSDCMEMSAITQTVGTEKGALMALQAGTDLVLVSHRAPRQRASFEAVRAAVQAGQLSRDDVRQAAERVLRLKQRMGSWDGVPDRSGLAIVGSAAHQRLRDEAFARSTTLVRDTGGLIPLRLAPDDRVLVLSQQRDKVTEVEDRDYTPDALVASMRTRHDHVSARAIPPYPSDQEGQAILAAAAAADVLVLVTLNAHLRDQTDLRLRDLLQRLVRQTPRLVGLAVGSPYDLLAMPELGTYLVTYEYSAPALVAAVGGIFGEHALTGHLPISLDIGSGAT